jgi:hypothetical protein
MGAAFAIGDDYAVPGEVAIRAFQDARFGRFFVPMHAVDPMVS